MEILFLRLVRPIANLFLFPARFWPIWGNGLTIFFSTAVLLSTMGIVIAPVVSLENIFNIIFGGGATFVFVGFMLSLNDGDEDDFSSQFAKETAELGAIINPVILPLVLVVGLSRLIIKKREEDKIAW